MAKWYFLVNWDWKPTNFVQQGQILIYLTWNSGNQEFRFELIQKHWSRSLSKATILSSNKFLFQHEGGEVVCVLILPNFTCFFEVCFDTWFHKLLRLLRRCKISIKFLIFSKEVKRGKSKLIGRFDIKYFGLLTTWGA